MCLGGTFGAEVEAACAFNLVSKKRLFGTVKMMAGSNYFVNLSVQEYVFVSTYSGQNLPYRTLRSFEVDCRRRFLAMRQYGFGKTPSWFGNWNEQD